MRKAIISVLLAGCALTIPALAQTPPRNFIHERIQLRTFLHHENIRGWLVMIDLNDGQGKNINSQLQGFLVSNGAMIFDCSGPTQGLVGPNDAPGIVQVGPFAQQARGDTNLIDFALQGSCPLPPRTVLEIDCPFQGLTVTKAPSSLIRPRMSTRSPACPARTRSEVSTARSTASSV